MFVIETDMTEDAAIINLKFATTERVHVSCLLQKVWIDPSVFCCEEARGPPQAQTKGKPEQGKTLNCDQQLSAFGLVFWRHGPYLVEFV